MKTPLMNRFCLSLLSISLLMTAGRPARAEAEPDRPLPLKILFAGKPETGRTKDFVDYLKTQFTTVEETSFLTLTENQAQPFDVIILDWEGLPPRYEDKPGFIIPALSETYSKPTVMIGAGSLGLGRKLQLKLNDMCVCLTGSAHSLRESHDLFKKPYKINVQYEDAPTPSHYYGWPGHETLPKTIKVWKVHNKAWSIDDPNDLTNVPGMVSDPFGFLDSPETEIISGGINLKTHDAVAIGRQANFLLWGFSGAPADLLPEAKKCFVNAVCYIKNFDGTAPLVRKVYRSASRDWALIQANSYKIIKDRSAFMAGLPESLKKDPAEAENYYKERCESMLNSFPEALRIQLGDDPDSYIKYYKDNLEYVYYNDKSDAHYLVDDDARALQISNRSVSLLEHCVQALDEGNDQERALRLLKRYTLETFERPSEWRQWLDENHGHLYFTDNGDYKFRVSKSPVKPQTPICDLDPRFFPSGVSAFQFSEPSRLVNDQRPVRATVAVSEDRDAAGQADNEARTVITLKIEIAPNWHIDASNRLQGLQLKLRLPDAFEPVGDWEKPEPERSPDGLLSYSGHPKFQMRVRRTGIVGNGARKAICIVHYQACDSYHCLLPKDLELLFEIDRSSATAP